jgi:microcystin-dependent protein
MPRQANGTMLPPANTMAIPATTISSSAFNTLETDICSEITNSLDRGGRSAMTANLPMGNNKITGMADPTVATDATTKAYVDALVSAFFSTGDGKFTLKSTPDTGWLLADDGTFGNASSGSSNRNNPDTLPLFTLLFNAPFTDANAPIFTSGGGATTRAAQVSASAAWAANCRMSLPKTLGRALAFAGAGSGLTSRLLGQFLGEEAHQLSQSELPATGVGVSVSGSVSGSVNTTGNINFGFGSSTTGGGGFGFNYPTGQGVVTSTGSMSGSMSGATTALGSGLSHNNMQPTSFWNVMVKL